MDGPRGFTAAGHGIACPHMATLPYKVYTLFDAAALDRMPGTIRKRWRTRKPDDWKKKKGRKEGWAREEGVYMLLYT